MDGDQPPVGLVEYVWKRQQEIGGPLTAADLTPFFHVPALSVRLKMRDIGFPIQLCLLTEKKHGKSLYTEPGWYSLRSQ